MLVNQVIPNKGDKTTICNRNWYMERENNSL